MKRDWYLSLMSAILQEATDLAKRSKDIRDVAVALQREERSGNKGRNWRKNVRRVERVGQRNPA
jgi:LMBR1 domain-containing protein 1